MSEDGGVHSNGDVCPATEIMREGIISLSIFPNII